MQLGQLKNIEIKDGSALITINPTIYSLSAIFNAAYCMCDKAFIMVDGDPTEEILVEISPKDNSEIRKLIENFNDELISYVIYEVRDERSRDLRNSILQKIVLANRYEKYKDKFDKIFDERWVEYKKSEAPPDPYTQEGEKNPDPKSE